MSRYSRLASVEERRNLSKAVRFFLLTIIILGLLGYFGIPLLTKISDLVNRFKKNGVTATLEDRIPPPPPTFSDLPSATNQSEQTVSGNSEPESDIQINLNTVPLETIKADRDGHFQLKLTLKDGVNTLSATAKDASGNESLSSSLEQIAFDHEPPEVKINAPKNDASFYGERQRLVNIAGQTEPSAEITINDHFVPLESSGRFFYSYRLSDGENNLAIKAKDEAGNETDISLKLNFSP
jgi:hypothetical protein